MMFDAFPKSEFDVVAPDGTIRCSIKGIFDGRLLVIDDPSAQILQGDEVRRRLPNGTEEAFEVVDPKFFEGFRRGGIPAHYQVDVRRKGNFPRGQGGHYVHVSGPNARVNIESHDQSTNIAVEGDVFGKLIAKLESEVKDPEALDRLLTAIEEMKLQRDKRGFAAAYQRFISLTADHIGIIAPFLPALTRLL